jgi:uroporphyrinogen-III decarboxylase
METEKNWSMMTPAEKREERYRTFLEPPGIRFVSKEAEKNYKVRAQRIISVYKVQEPDRVPVSLPVANMPAYLDGTDFHTVMYDYDRQINAWTKFNQAFPEADTFTSPAMVLPGPIYDLMDYRLYSWPGHGLPLDATGIQFVEGEYMKANEYDLLIKNPSDFWQRTYIPRVLGAFEPWRMLQPFTTIIELPAVHFMPYMLPEVRASFKKLLDIGEKLAEWSQIIGTFSVQAMSAGYPGMSFGFAKAPFDTLGDTLRGTKGIITDMYRQPEKLLEAIDVITDFTISQTIAALNPSKTLIAMFPLHKGADGFMSQKQFEKFYWPSLKKVMNALLAEGIMPMLFAEGTFNSRLESVNEFPKGAVTWLFDRSDMVQAKRILGKNCCISGNVPTSLIVTGTPQEVKAYCRKLIEDCGQGGGYILAGGAQVDVGKPENLHAMLEAARDYGTYKK